LQCKNKDETFLGVRVIVADVDAHFAFVWLIIRRSSTSFSLKTLDISLSEDISSAGSFKTQSFGLGAE